jgi:dipeptidyl-peptidase-4
VVFTDRDAAWAARTPGSPARLADGRLVMASDGDGSRRLVVGGTPVTPLDLCVRSVVHVGAEEVLFTANPIDDATGVLVSRWSADGIEAITQGDGVHTAVAGGRTLVVRSVSLDRDGATTTVLSPSLDGPHPGGRPAVRTIDSLAAVPLVRPEVQIHHLGERRLPTAILLPAGHRPGDRLPVLLDPYGGPHAQRVVQARGAYSSSQWFADQGFAVVVADGRGTPGRGAAWERAVHLDLATPVLEDQITALHHAAEEHPLDLTRVAIRGWSFGGFLAALAVLRRPDVFHAAVAGAPVTEWRLYDTHYTERYLGDPNVQPEVYDANSLLPLAADLTRPLLLIHGLADDNVVAAHTLRMSSALLAAGRPHEVLPLVGITHMTPQEVVAEHLLLHQLDFLRRSLGLPHPD